MTRSSLGLIVVVGFLLRLVFLIVNLEFMTLPQGGADARAFERLAWAHSEDGRQPIEYYLTSSAHTIVLLGSYVYDLTGRAPYLLGLIMVVLGTAIIYLAYHAAYELWGDRRRARLVAWACALFPQLVLHSALFLREAPVAFCLAAAALCAIRFIKRDSLPHVAWFALWVFVGALFHSGVIFAIPALLVGMMLVRPQRGWGRFKFHVVNIAAAALLVSVIYIANETGYGLGQFGGSLDEAMLTFEQQELRGTLGDAAFPEWMRLRGGLDEVWKVPVRYVAFLFSPLVPFMVRTGQHWLGVFDAALYLLLFWGLMRNWSAVRKNRIAVVLLVIVLALFLVYALGVSNFGTAIRHRAKMAPLLLILALGLPALKRVKHRPAGRSRRRGRTEAVPA